MGCSVTILHDGKSTVRALRKGWGTKYALTFPVDFAAEKKRVRVVIQVDGREVSGFYQIDAQQIGLPPQRLAKTGPGFGAYWPAVDGISVGVNLSGDDIEKLEVRPQTKQWWGVFRNNKDCKCQKIGPQDTKPKRPDGYVLVGYYNDAAEADAGATRCEKQLPQDCGGSGGGPPTGIARATLSFGSRVPGAYLTRNVSMSASGHFATTGFFMSGRLLGPDVIPAPAPKKLLANITITRGPDGGYPTISGELLGPENDLLALPETSTSYGGAGPDGIIYDATWANLSLRKMGIFDLTIRVLIPLN
jgi:hypothetical protein